MTEDSNQSQSDLPDTSKTKGNAKDFNVLNFRDSEKKSVSNIFGIEFVAPQGITNPIGVYLLFIVVNIIVFVIIKSQLGL